jgi:hypothetical protein
MLARRLPERDNKPTIIDGPEKVRNISNFLFLFLFRPYVRSKGPSLRPDLPSSTVMFLSSVGAPFLRPGLHSHRASVLASTDVVEIQRGTEGVEAV